MVTSVSSTFSPYFLVSLFKEYWINFERAVFRGKYLFDLEILQKLSLFFLMEQTGADSSSNVFFS